LQHNQLQHNQLLSQSGFTLIPYSLRCVAVLIGCRIERIAALTESTGWFWTFLLGSTPRFDFARRTQCDIKVERLVNGTKEDSMNKKRLLVTVCVVAIFAFGAIKGWGAWNARVTPAKIAAGKALFEHEWSVNDPLCNQGDGLGPVFNARSCVACHFQAGIGGASGNATNVTAFEVQQEDENATPPTGVVHANAVSEAFLESKDIVHQLYPVQSRLVIVQEGGGRYGGGGGDCAPAPIRERSILERDDPVIFHQLNSPALFGAGLIDEISNLSVSLHGHKRVAQRIANELGGDFSGNRLGMVNMVSGGVGKFGWKGQFASLEDFVASACAMEIGLTNPLHSQPVAREHRTDHDAKMDMTRRQLNELVSFVRSLPRPQQVLPTEPAALKQVMQGEQLFNETGCADCHVKDFGGIEAIYSDFHLYNLEPMDVAAASDYSDGTPEQEFDFNGTHPHPDQWQTPALWGVADSAPYFHDGGSPTLLAAIKRHRGQANSSLHRFQNLKKAEQANLIAFLKTLKAPAIETQAPETVSH
jgi:CxxC motif-containing protein (DUF1111 family)